MSTFVALNWECLRRTPEFLLRRASRFLVAELEAPHVVVSTSGRYGGQSLGIRYLANHQSCEATSHKERYAEIDGHAAYHELVCAEMDLAPSEVALMGTAANMNYAAVVVAEDEGLEVTAVVTAGVHGN